MDFLNLTIDILKFLSNLFGGSLGMGIILLTLIVRGSMWRLSYSQQKSMRDMQRFQPEMKRIQERFKSDPNRMQAEMMEFYKKHNFNPMKGCLPLIIQMPIWILLYSALISPQFIALVNEKNFHANFLFIKRLDATLKGTTGQSNDGEFQVNGKNDMFIINKDKVNIKLLDGTVKENVKTNNKKALVVMGGVEPGQNVDFKININDLDMNFDQQKNIESAKVSISDRTTREVEDIEFVRDGDILKASIPTTTNSDGLHWDVLLLVLIFGLTMFGAQKLMMSTQTTELDPQQKAMQKMMSFTMPVMLTATFIFIPIPAGVLLYLVVSNFFQVFQTVVINKQLDAEELKRKEDLENKIADAKKVEAKEVKTVKEEE